MTMLPIAVLAGGLATRMGDLTRNTPKSLLLVAGEPFIAHQLRLFRREGIERVILCTGHFGEQIAEFVGDGSRFGLQVGYSSDGDKLRGTGGAIKKALPLLGKEFFVTYGDSYLDISYQPVANAFRSAGMPGLMTILRNEDKWDTSNVLFQNGRIVRYSKVPAIGMKHIDFGLGVLSAQVFESEPQVDPFDLSVTYANLVEIGQMAGFEVEQRFYEIGSPRGLSETSAHLLETMAPE